MKPQTGMLVIPDDNDKTTMPDDGLHAFVCPHCGNDVFEGKDIISYDDYDGRKCYRCWGGFGRITYRWIPHKCTACNAKFLVWKATKSINGSVIRCYVALILTIIAMCALTGLAIGRNKSFWLADIPGLIALMIWIGNIEGETCDVDIGLEDMAKVAHFPNDKKESPEPSSPAEMALNILRRNQEEAKSIIVVPTAESIKSACMASPNELRTAMMESSTCARKSPSL